MKFTVKIAGLAVFRVYKPGWLSSVREGSTLLKRFMIEDVCSILVASLNQDGVPPAYKCWNAFSQAMNG